MSFRFSIQSLSLLSFQTSYYLLSSFGAIELEYYMTIKVESIFKLFLQRFGPKLALSYHNAQKLFDWIELCLALFWYICHFTKFFLNRRIECKLNIASWKQLFCHRGSLCLSHFCTILYDRIFILLACEKNTHEKYHCSNRFEQSTEWMEGCYLTLLLRIIVNENELVFPNNLNTHAQKNEIVFDRRNKRFSNELG